MKNSNKFSEKEILESLSRSGYLLESEITKLMVEYGFFVESNISSLDPMTGKSREIDLIAEFDHEYDKERYKWNAIAKATFVFEIKNNDSPLVLLTKHVWHPGSLVVEGMKVGVTTPEYLNYHYYRGFYEVMFEEDEQKDMFTQYCSFSKKSGKEELMAHHPENVYSSLMKITHFCEESSEIWNNRDKKYNNDYFRNFLYLPIVLVNEDLYELENDEDNEFKLKQVECSRLVFNYHYKQESKTAIIHIITKAGLKDFLIDILKAEKKVAENMIEAKNKYNEKANAE